MKITSKKNNKKNATRSVELPGKITAESYCNANLEPSWRNKNFLMPIKCYNYKHLKGRGPDPVLIFMDSNQIVEPQI